LKHVKNFLSGIFSACGATGIFDGANPVKLAEIPAFVINGAETKPYSLEEIGAMLKVLSEPSVKAVATAAFTGLRLGELRGLMWESAIARCDRSNETVLSLIVLQGAASRSRVLFSRSYLSAYLPVIWRRGRDSNPPHNVN
jgi:integrase